MATQGLDYELCEALAAASADTDHRVPTRKAARWTLVGQHSALHEQPITTMWTTLAFTLATERNKKEKNTICVCTYIHVHTHTNICTFGFSDIHMYIHIDTCVFVRVCTGMQLRGNRTSDSVSSPPPTDLFERKQPGLSRAWPTDSVCRRM